MLDIAWSELFVVGAVALVAIGPKDLPKTMLMLGRATRQLRGIAQGLRQQFDQLTYEAELAARAADKAGPDDPAPQPEIRPAPPEQPPPSNPPDRDV